MHGVRTLRGVKCGSCTLRGVKCSAGGGAAPPAAAAPARMIHFEAPTIPDRLAWVLAIGAAAVARGGAGERARGRPLLSRSARAGPPPSMSSAGPGSGGLGSVTQFAVAAV